MITETKVRDVLAHPFDHQWTLQGFGMLRTYLDDEHVERLNIWDPDTAVDEVSTIHDHPWDFDSTIVRGELHNQRFVITDEHDVYGAAYQASRLVPGPGGGLIAGTTTTVTLGRLAIECYRPGETYHMDAPELHESLPSRGCVTVNRRTFLERDEATVCWPADGAWVSAEPRPATRDEVTRFITYAWLAGQ